MERIVLAYSGGLDTSVAVKWLADRYDAEVVAVTIDLGQGKELDDVRERALSVGAVRSHVVDAREEFAQDYILPALQAGAIYEAKYPLATALGRPLISKKLVEIAEMEGAGMIAHGCTGKGNDQVRMDVSARALNPALAVVAPARVWGMTRPEEIAYAREHGIPVPATVDSPYSTDSNLWGRSIECGVLEDPWTEPPEEIYALTRSPADAPDAPAYVEVDFEQGTPIRVNGVAMPLTELIHSLETIVGAHGIGRIDMVENRLVGIKSREIYEAPAATVLHAAHRELEALVVPRDLERLKAGLSRVYADLVYDGLWFSATREAIDAFVGSVQRYVTGTVRLKLSKGSCCVVGRRSPASLYDTALATYDEGDAFDHEAAEGFIRIWGLPIANAAAKRRAAGGSATQDFAVSGQPASTPAGNSSTS
ncbi:MAG: argininosuccinate synthase [Acidobacteria bacterium]|nr:argininosuccinate synthase [Acidobacteriota bacterium]